MFGTPRRLVVSVFSLNFLFSFSFLFQCDFFEVWFPFLWFVTTLVTADPVKKRRIKGKRNLFVIL